MYKEKEQRNYLRKQFKSRSDRFINQLKVDNTITRGDELKVNIFKNIKF